GYRWRVLERRVVEGIYGERCLQLRHRVAGARNHDLLQVQHVALEGEIVLHTAAGDCHRQSFGFVADVSRHDVDRTPADARLGNGEAVMAIDRSNAANAELWNGNVSARERLSAFRRDLATETDILRPNRRRSEREEEHRRRKQ